MNNTSSSENPVSKAMREFHELEQRHQCDVMLNVLLGGQLAELWWNRSNSAFSNQTPNSVFKNNPQSVLQYLRSQCSGDYY